MRQNASVIASVGPCRRFWTDAELAAHAGRHRLRRRQPGSLAVALTQACYSPEAKAYLERRVSEGKSRREAIRALRRFIVRAVWRLWQECETSPVSSPVENVA